MRIGFLCSVAALLLISGCAGMRGHMGGTAQNDHNILTGGPFTGTLLSDLPEPVRETLNETVPKAEIADIDKQLANGKVYYKISFSNPNTNGSVIISQDGKITPPAALNDPKAF